MDTVRDTNTTRTRIRDTTKSKKVGYGDATSKFLLYIDKFIKYQNHNQNHQVKQRTIMILLNKMSTKLNKKNYNQNHHGLHREFIN